MAFRIQPQITKDKKIKLLKEQEQGLITSINSSKVTIGVLENKLKELDVDVSIRTAYIENLDKLAKEKQDKLVILSDKVQSFSAELQGIIRDTENKKSALHKIDLEIITRQSEGTTKLNAAIQELSSEKDKLSKDLVAIKSEFDITKSELQQIVNQTNTKRDALQKLQINVDKLVSHIKTLEVEIEALEKKKVVAQNNLAVLDEAISLKKRGVTSTESEFGSVMNDITAKKQLIKELDIKIQSAKEELEEYAIRLASIAKREQNLNILAKKVETIAKKAGLTVNLN